MSGKLVLPKENLYRAVYSPPLAAGEVGHPAVSMKLRAAEDGAGDPAESDGRTLVLQWALFDVFTEIDSWYEGNFMERIAPGAFKKTIRENAANMRILLQHGRDPQLGMKPIASVDVVEENDLGGYAEGRLFDGLDPLIIEGLRAGAYGASFRFRVLREEIDEEPGVSDHNPRGLPERTIKEAAVSEFGPVTWGAYSDASAGVRSLTDEMSFGALRDMPQERLADMARFWLNAEQREPADELEGGEGDDATPTREEDAPSEVVAEIHDTERREQEGPDEPGEMPTRKARDYLGRNDGPPSWRL